MPTYIELLAALMNEAMDYADLYDEASRATECVAPAVREEALSVLSIFDKRSEACAVYIQSRILRDTIETEMKKFTRELARAKGPLRRPHGAFLSHSSAKNSYLSASSPYPRYIQLLIILDC